MGISWIVSTLHIMPCLVGYEAKKDFWTVNGLADSFKNVPFSFRYLNHCVFQASKAKQSGAGGDTSAASSGATLALQVRHHQLIAIQSMRTYCVIFVHFYAA